VTSTGPVELRGLVVDWGGVLTERLDVQAWADAEGIDHEHYLRVLEDWFGPAYRLESEVNPVHALERGEMTVPHFEQQLAAHLRRRDGAPVRPDGLLQRMFAGFTTAPSMGSLVRRAKRSGLRTALLSNSWGNAYPREGWDDMFDAVVISGEVGMRKPELQIFQLTCDRLGLAPSDCVFVDDVAYNVDAAEAVGMIGILHTSYDDTARQLDRLFGFALSGGAPKGGTG
jgi:epoxide hydrolase-like predicted phosphatase